MSTLELSNLHFKHLASTAWILKNLSLKLRAGETALIVGDNGSGKSTLGKVIAGLNRPESGNVLLNGRDVTTFEVSQRPEHVIYMGQTSYLQFFRASIEEEIKFATKISGQRAVRVDETYQHFRLPRDVSMKPMDLAYPAMWRLQLLLLSVVFNPSVLFIDEIVAPAARAQMDALQAVIKARSDRKQVTLFAYQRPLPLEGLRRFELREGSLYESDVSE